MRIGLVDVDGHNFPNYALMRISGYHKAKGDDVEWAVPLKNDYDIVYKSKIFTFTPDDMTPWKYKKCLISVDRYLERGEHAGRLDESFITKIE